MLNKDLEELSKDPLGLLDYINKKVWKNPPDSKVKAFISKTRAEIVSEPDKQTRYMMILSYMTVLREKVCGNVGDLINNVSDKIKRIYN